MAATLSPPVHSFSYGSTVMPGEESKSADCRKKYGDDALANGVRGVIVMVGSPAQPLEIIVPTRLLQRAYCLEVATEANPGRNSLAFVWENEYENHRANYDVPLADRRIAISYNHDVDAHANDEFDRIHDTFPVMIRVFSNGHSPTTPIFQNARYDSYPVYTYRWYPSPTPKIRPPHHRH